MSATKAGTRHPRVNPNKLKQGPSDPIDAPSTHSIAGQGWTASMRASIGVPYVRELPSSCQVQGVVPSANQEATAGLEQTPSQYHALSAGDDKNGDADGWGLQANARNTSDGDGDGDEDMTQAQTPTAALCPSPSHTVTGKIEVSSAIVERRATTQEQSAGMGDCKVDYQNRVYKRSRPAESDFERQHLANYPLADGGAYPELKGFDFRVPHASYHQLLLEAAVHRNRSSDIWGLAYTGVLPSKPECKSLIELGLHSSVGLNALSVALSSDHKDAAANRVAAGASYGKAKRQKRSKSRNPWQRFENDRCWELENDHSIGSPSGDDFVFSSAMDRPASLASPSGPSPPCAPGMYASVKTSSLARRSGFKAAAGRVEVLSVVSMATQLISVIYQGRTPMKFCAEWTDRLYLVVENGDMYEFVRLTIVKKRGYLAFKKTVEFMESLRRALNRTGLGRSLEASESHPSPIVFLPLYCLVSNDTLSCYSDRFLAVSGAPFVRRCAASKSIPFFDLVPVRNLNPADIANSFQLTTPVIEFHEKNRCIPQMVFRKQARNTSDIASSQSISRFHLDCYSLQLFDRQGSMIPISPSEGVFFVDSDGSVVYVDLYFQVTDDLQCLLLSEAIVESAHAAILPHRLFSRSPESPQWCPETIICEGQPAEAMPSVLVVAARDLASVDIGAVVPSRKTGTCVDYQHIVRLCDPSKRLPVTLYLQALVECDTSLEDAVATAPEPKLLLDELCPGYDVPISVSNGSSLDHTYPTTASQPMSDTELFERLGFPPVSQGIEKLVRIRAANDSREVLPPLKPLQSIAGAVFTNSNDSLRKMENPTKP